MLSVHHLPGRIRFPYPGLRGNAPLAARLEQQLRARPEVRLVLASAETGRVLVCYEPGWLAEAAPALDALLGGAAEAGHGGLTALEAQRLLERHGPNTLRTQPPPSFWRRLVEQLRDPMVLLLLAGASVSTVARRGRDALTIGAVLLLNAVVGATQAGKADKAVTALRKLGAPEARVMRDGRAVTIPVAAVVPGDLLLVEEGERAAADACITWAAGAEADESLLTGESLPVAKAAAPPGTAPAPGIGRPEMLYAGTTLTRGRCTAIVTATGVQTEMGRIARLLGEVQEGPTPLQERMHRLGGTLVRTSLFICGGVALIGLLRGRPLMEMFLTGISLAVAAIPEGLPTFVTLGLATGVRAMARRKALVRRLQAVETLGSATVICSDKTGTLTTNQMTVRQIYAGGRRYHVTGSGYEPAGEFRRADAPAPVDPLTDAPDLAALLTAGALCSNARLEREGPRWTVRGDATEGALLAAAAKAGIRWSAWRRTGELPFESARRLMTVRCDGPGGPADFTKGAPEAVLERCTHLVDHGERRPLTPRQRERILHEAAAMAGEACRVLAMASRPAGGRGSIKEEGLTFLGLTGMMDPPRPEVPAALDRCRQAGIRVVMLTGDHPLTAAAIAREIGLMEPGDLVLSGDELEAMSERELLAAIPRLRVGARVSPAQKLRVVRALRAHGHVVAMTGDGANDAPAVKEADIGIAMGRAGTEVTKEAAGLVLADDNFATIVSAVEQGRVSYNNIRRSVQYLLASNTGEMVVMLTAVALALPLPLLPLQILWLNLVGDGLPALALGAEPADGTEMARPPRPRKESVFAGGLDRCIIRHGLRMGVTALGLYLWALRSGRALPLVRTMTLATLVLGQLLYFRRCRGDSNRRPNPLAPWAMAGTVALLLGSIYFGPLRQMLQLVPLSGGDWLAAGTAAALGVL